MGITLFEWVFPLREGLGWCWLPVVSCNPCKERDTVGVHIPANAWLPVLVSSSCQLGNAFFFLAPKPSLSLLPDNVVLKIMSFLDIPSLMSLAQINHRYYLLHSDEFIWTDVDLSTVPRLDVQKVKKLIREKLHPALWRLTLQSNAIQCQRQPKMRPIITGSALDDLFKKCPNVRSIKLDNVDVLQVSS